MGPPDLLTPRLRLRPLRRADADAIYAYSKDPAVAEHVLWDAHASLDDTRAYLAMVESRYLGGVALEWAIEHDGIVVGTIGYFDRREDHRRAELGFALAPWMRGQGIVAEAARGVLAYGFGTLRLQRVVATVRVEHAASRRVLTKLGFTEEGTLRRHLYVKRRWWDVAYYGLLADEREVS